MMPVKKPVATNHTAAHGQGSSSVDQHVCPNITRMTVKTKVWFELDGDFVIGECGADLLAGIARHGSLAQAAMGAGWSYRHAWGYVRRAERVLGIPLVERVPGKGSARGMRLTLAARQLLARVDEALAANNVGHHIATINPVEPPVQIDWAHQLVAEGHAHWNGGKPTGAGRPAKITGRTASSIVREDRR